MFGPGFRQDVRRPDSAHPDCLRCVLQRDALNLYVLNAVADVAHQELAAQFFPLAYIGRLAVRYHQAQFRFIEVQVAAAPLDYLVVAFVSGDFHAVLFCELLNARHVRLS